jgi:hypothetical protein
VNIAYKTCTIATNVFGMLSDEVIVFDTDTPDEEVLCFINTASEGTNASLYPGGR